MERNPGTPAEPESDSSEYSTSSDKDSTKKKRRRVGSAAAASTTSEAQISAQEATEVHRKVPTALEHALAQLATEERRRKAAAEEATVTSNTPEATTYTEGVEEKEGSDESSEFDVENESGDESNPESILETEENSENTETYEPLVDYSIGATEFSGGEVVIDLGGSSVEEHVVSLSLEPSETVASGETPTPVVVHEQAVDPVTTEVEPVGVAAEEPSLQPEIISAFYDMLETMPTEATQQPMQATEVLDPIHADVSNETSASIPTQPEVAYLQQQTSVEGVSNVVPSPNAVQTPHLRSTQAEQVISKADFDDAIYRATKTGQNRGVAAGLLAGAGYEHFKHKRREKRVAKKHQETTKKLAEARKSLAFTTEQQVKQRAEYTAQADDSSRQLAETQRRVSTLEQQRQIHPVAERPAVVAPVANIPKTRSEQAPQPALEAEPLAVAPEHRLQTSAWHTIEVDARTGRAVEKPVFEYGHEYYREQAQENALGLPPAQDTTEQKPPTRTSTVTHDSHNTLATFGGSSLPPMYSSTPSQPVPQTAKPAPASPKPAQPTHVPPATKVVAKPTQPASPIWPLVLALVVVVICLSLLLR